MAYYDVPANVLGGGTGRAGLTPIFGALFGAGNSAVFSGNALSNGQLYIGKTSDFPQAATLTAGANINITSGPGAITISATGGGFGPPDEANIIWVRKNGSNSNSGLNIESAVLTFGYAVTLAAAKSPSAINRFVIVCLDDGTYTENVTLPSYIDIYAPSANLIGTVYLSDSVNIDFASITVPSGYGIVKSGTGFSFASVGSISCLTTAGGAVVSTPTGELFLEFDQISVADGTGIGSFTSGNVGKLVFSGKEILVSGSGYGIGSDDASSYITGQVVRITSSTTGSAIFMKAGTSYVTCTQIVASGASINVDGSGTLLDLLCNNISGARSVTGGAIFNLLQTPQSAPNVSGMPNGALIVGNNGGRPSVSTLTAGTNVTITNGPGSITISAGSNAAPNETHIYYVRSNGSDSNTGLNMANAVQTFGHAITLAIGQSPSATNRFVIECLDDGIYPESINVPSFVDINAQNATLGDSSVTAVTLLTCTDNSTIRFNTIYVPTNRFGIVKNSGTSDCNVLVTNIICNGGATGVRSSAGTLHLVFEEMSISGGFGIGYGNASPQPAANIVVEGGTIILTGGGVAVSSTTLGYIQGKIASIVGVNATAIAGISGTIALFVNQINTTVGYNVDAGQAACSLSLFCNSFSGTRLQTNGAVVNFWAPVIPMQDGQILIGNTSNAVPTVARLTAGSNVNISNYPGQIIVSATGGGDSSQEANIIWVRANGNDSNNGTNLEQAVQTFKRAIVSASSYSPTATNRFVICCLDDGLYLEDILLPQYIDIWAPNATLGNGTAGGAITLADGCSVTYKILNVRSGYTGVNYSGSAAAYVSFQTVTCFVAAGGFTSTGTGTLYGSFATMSVGIGLGISTSGSGSVVFNGQDIIASTSGGYCIYQNSSGTIRGDFSRLYSLSGSASYGIWADNGVVDVSVNTININGTAVYLNAVSHGVTVNVNGTISGGTVTNVSGGLFNYAPVPALDAGSIGYSDGQLIIGNSSTGNTNVNNLIAGSGISIQNDPGSITIGDFSGMNLVFAATTGAHNNVIGDATVYNIPWDTVIYNAGTLDVTKAIWKCPGAGFYYIVAGVQLTNILAATPGALTWYENMGSSKGMLQYLKPDVLTVSNQYVTTGNTISPGIVPQDGLFTTAVSYNGNSALTANILAAWIMIFKVA